MNISSKLSKLGQAIFYKCRRRVTVMLCNTAEKLEHEILILINKIDRVAVTNLPSTVWITQLKTSV